MIGILFLKLQRLRLTGIFFALAISAKLSMLIVFPFVILYLYNNKPLRQLLYEFGIGFIAAFALLGLPFLWSSSGMIMLFKNPEMSDILSLSFEVSQGAVIYILPILFAGILYFIWRVRRLNFDNSIFSLLSGDEWENFDLNYRRVLCIICTRYFI